MRKILAFTISALLILSATMTVCGAKEAPGYTIVASVSGADGTYSVNGIAATDDTAPLLAPGSDSSVRIFSPSQQAVIHSLKVDNSVITEANGKTEYTVDFPEVSAAHSVTAVFISKELTLIYVCKGNGRLVDDKGNPLSGEMKVFTYGDDLCIGCEPSDGYAIESVLVNGSSDMDARYSGIWRQNNADRSYTVEFVITKEKAQTVSLTVSCGEGGTVSPGGVLTLLKGESINISVIADSGYAPDTLYIGGMATSDKVTSLFSFNRVVSDISAHFTFRPLDTPIESRILGDADLSGEVNVKDATLIQKSAASIQTLTRTQRLLADVNSDTQVNVRDATAIQKFSALIDTGYRIGESIEV